jgi:hypothetical protein
MITTFVNDKWLGIGSYEEVTTWATQWAARACEWQLTVIASILDALDSDIIILIEEEVVTANTER